MCLGDVSWGKCACLMRSGVVCLYIVGLEVCLCDPGWGMCLGDVSWEKCGCLMRSGVVCLYDAAL